MRVAVVACKPNIPDTNNEPDDEFGEHVSLLLVVFNLNFCGSSELEAGHQQRQDVRGATGGIAAHTREESGGGDERPLADAAQNAGKWNSP